MHWLSVQNAHSKPLKNLLLARYNERNKLRVQIHLSFQVYVLAQIHLGNGLSLSSVDY